MTMTYRAAYWTSDDGQADVRLTGPEQSTLPDSELLAAAYAEAERGDLDLSTGHIAIGEWVKQTAPHPRRSRPAAILVHMTPDERERLRAVARKAGLGLGPWLRMLAIREAG